MPIDGYVYLNKIRKDRNNRVNELHTIGAVGQLLLHRTGMKWNDNSYRKVNGAHQQNLFSVPAWANSFSQTHKLTPKSWLNVDSKDIMARLLQRDREQ